MRLTLFTLVVALCATACTADGDGSASSTSLAEPSTTVSVTEPSTTIPFPTDGDVVRVGVLELPATLNPIAQGGTWRESTVIQQTTLPGAFVYDATAWTTIPNLALRIPSTTAGDVELDRDRQTVTWQITPDARWSDGTPVSGADFAFTLEARLGLTECGGQTEVASVLGFDIVEVGEKSITVEMRGPTTAYESMFEAIIPAHVTDGSTVCTDTGLDWPSAGPFVPHELTAESVKIRRNDDYWRAAPSIDAIEFVRYEDGDALVAAFGAGEVQVVVTEDAALAGALAEAGGVVDARAAGRAEQLAFNFALEGPTEDVLLRVPAFRRAVARAIDRSALAESAGGVPVDSVVRGAEPSSPWSDLGHDVDEATSLLATACDAVGRDCESDPPVLRLIASDFGSRPELVERIVTDLAAVGIQAEADVMSSQAFFDAIEMPGWDVAVLAIGERPGVSAAAASLLQTIDPDGPGNVYTYGRIGSTAATGRTAFQVAVFVGQISVSPDIDRVARLLGELQAALASDVVLVPLVAEPQFTVVDEERLAGVVPNASPSGVLWNAADWTYRDG